MYPLRSAAALAACTVLCSLAAPTALAASPSPKAPSKLPSGMYGSKDPKYDGVWRQSLALLGQDSAGVTPAAKAVDWLVRQQCSSGGFAAYRADVADKCDAKTLVDSNSTAAAVQALAALGKHGGEIRQAVDWLKSVQNQDGGWGYAPGGPSDANSTSVVIGALTAAGENPGKTTSSKGKSAYDALLSFQLGCGTKAGERGAFAYQPDKAGKLAANADATAAGALAGLGKGLEVEPLDQDTDEAVEPLDCGGADSKDAREPEEAAAGAAAYLAGALKKDGQHLRVLAPGADKPIPDLANTADAVIALAAGGHRAAAEKPLKWLERNSADWAKDNPAGLAALVLATRATGGDPRDFGGADLVRQLNATGPAPQAVGSPEQTSGQDEENDGNGDSALWWIVGTALTAGAGAGIAFVLRSRKKQQ